MSSTTETPFETLFERAEVCSKTTLEILKLKAIDTSVDVISTFVMKLAMYMVMGLFVVIGSIGLALWIGDVLGKSYFGFFIIAGAYALLAVWLRSCLYQWVKIPVSNFIITQILHQKTA